MAILEDMASALRTRFDTLVGTPEGVTVQYPNTEATPPAGGLWVNLAILPGQPQEIEVGEEGLYRTRGVLIASVLQPVDQGDSLLWVLVDKINLAFRAVSVPFVTLETPVPDSARREGAYWRVDVVCPFYFDEIP